MLFNSIEFLFILLPISILIYYTSYFYISRKASIIVLIICSLVFYSYWNPVYLLLLFFSILFNYSSYKYIIIQKKYSFSILIFSILINLLILFYYKYFNFFIHNINIAFDSSFNFEKIILPLAISFFTFQQITFLVDSYNQKVKNVKFIEYCLFVTFFPQLIAGPIVHHGEMIPQFSSEKKINFNIDKIGIGFLIFIIGLFKKTVIADGISKYSNHIFLLADSSSLESFFGSWVGATSYAFQIYFDFSGYSDMAFGIALMFCIVLPINFYSPYKCNNIIDFWKTWHITLSRFLKNYIYIPIGGNKYGEFLKYRNIFVTMLLGGIWHGAAWGFIIWGSIHGTFIIINHLWNHLSNQYQQLKYLKNTIVFGLISHVLTFLLITIAWVFFRAETLDGAVLLVNSMIGINGISLHHSLHSLVELFPSIFYTADITIPWFGPTTPLITVPMLIGLFLFVKLFPNTYQYFHFNKNKLDKSSYLNNIYKKYFSFKPDNKNLIIFALLILFMISYYHDSSEFLYWQF